MASNRDRIRLSKSFAGLAGYGPDRTVGSTRHSRRHGRLLLGPRCRPALAPPAPLVAAAVGGCCRRAPSLVGIGRRYDSIFSFGDSYTNTGNNPVAYAWCGIPDPDKRPPYGSTFFGRPTGRYYDGRLVIDFIAESLGLPLVPPFLARKRNGDRESSAFRHGPNFAPEHAVDADGDASVFPLNVSLSMQLQWFESLKTSLCATLKECLELFGCSLFFVVEIGINDYDSFLLDTGGSVQQVKALVPDVISTISMAIERLIKHGATSLVVSGTLLAGCIPPILALFAGADTASYDPRTGCLKELNELFVHHNTLLQESLAKIRDNHPDVELAYADFFSPVMAMVESPGKYGFDEDVLDACCGGLGSYDDSSRVIACGDPGAVTCENPSARLFWDGSGHLTEAANQYIADEWLSSICPVRLCLFD
ncbi:GDSL esterase/lipase At5g45910-like [Miscanthus floridulus]|uniref:GDSL esterase/lipase At5g45910-like n=1 Tax=Miscanthus floridulus TaxID=154761 RepID=UPI003458206F